MSPNSGGIIKSNLKKNAPTRLQEIVIESMNINVTLRFLFNNFIINNIFLNNCKQTTKVDERIISSTYNRITRSFNL